MFCYKQVFFTCWYLEQLQIPTGITLSGWLLWDDASTFQYYFIELCFPHFYERKHPCYGACTTSMNYASQKVIINAFNMSSAMIQILLLVQLDTQKQHLNLYNSINYRKTSQVIVAQISYKIQAIKCQK